jgi:hypothetical protein
MQSVLKRAAKVIVGVLITLAGLSIAASAFSIRNETDWYRFTKTEINLIAIGLFACGASLIGSVLILRLLPRSPAGQRWSQLLQLAILGSILMSYGFGTLLRAHARSAGEVIQHQLELLDAATQQYEIKINR